MPQLKQVGSIICEGQTVHVAIASFGSTSDVLPRTMRRSRRRVGESSTANSTDVGGDRIREKGEQGGLEDGDGCVPSALDGFRLCGTVGRIVAGAISGGHLVRFVCRPPFGSATNDSSS